jgi:uncharacterized membrane protein
MNKNSSVTLISYAGVALLFVYLAVVMSLSALARHNAFASSFDLAIFAQAIHNTWHGAFLYSSIKGGICLLGDHVSPILALLAPFYAIWDDASALLVLQAVMAASSVFPIYLIGREVLEDKKLPILFVVAYVLYLPLRNAIRFDFHPELIGDPLLLWAFYLILKNRLAFASLLLVLVLTTKETACAPVAILGLWVCFFARKRTFGILLFLVSLSLFFLEVLVIAPQFSDKSYFYLGGNYLSWAKDPAGFTQHLFQLSTATYLKKIFLPLGLFSFLSPSTLILTFPILFQNLAAKNLLARSTFFQYTAFLTPFVFVSAIYGFKNCVVWMVKYKVLYGFRAKAVTGVWLIAWSLIFSGKTEFQIIREYQNKNEPHFQYVRSFLKSVPSERSVRTHEVFAPHLANRKELYIYENQHPLEGGSIKAQNAQYVILDRRFLGGNEQAKLQELEIRGYQLMHAHDGFYVYTNNKLAP